MKLLFPSYSHFIFIFLCHSLLTNGCDGLLVVVSLYLHLLLTYYCYVVPIDFMIFQCQQWVRSYCVMIFRIHRIALHFCEIMIIVAVFLLLNLVTILPYYLYILSAGLFCEMTESMKCESMKCFSLITININMDFLPVYYFVRSFHECHKYGDCPHTVQYINTVLEKNWQLMQLPKVPTFTCFVGRRSERKRHAMKSFK
jgi:hypothetical protein